MAGTPKTATAFTELSELLIKQSNPSAEDILLNGLAADLPARLGNRPALTNAWHHDCLRINTRICRVVAAQAAIAAANAIINSETLGYCMTLAVAGVLRGGLGSQMQIAQFGGAIHQGSIECVKALSTSGMPLQPAWSMAIGANSLSRNGECWPSK